MTTIPVGALVRDRELPELGPGRIVAELGSGASRIVFEQKDEVRDVQVSRVEVNRLPLIPGTQVLVRLGRGGSSETLEGVVLDADLPDSPAQLCDYIVEIDGEKQTVSEAEIFPAGPASTAPVDQFDGLYWRGPFRFFARWGMHRMTSRMYEDAEGLPTFIGARITPHTQQMYAARQVLWGREQRRILADPSESDRMIEAGLVVQALNGEDPDLEVLVISAGARVREWTRQMELRFGGREYMGINRNRVEATPFADLAEVFRNDRVVVAADALEASGDARMMVGGGEWDVVVIDGAHRLDPEGEAYKMAREISERADAALVLSPMPAVPEVEELLPLFALARPEEFHPKDDSELSELMEAREELWEQLQTAIEARAAADGELDASTAEQLASGWRDLAQGDPVIEQQADAIEGEGENSGLEAIDALAEHVRQFYGLTNTVVRTSRDVAEEVGVEWAERRRETVEWEPADKEAELAEHLEAFPVPEEASLGQLALCGMYRRVAAETPDVFVDMITDRVAKLDSRRRPRGLDEDIIERLFADPAASDEETIWKAVLESVPEIDGERDWLAKALGITQDWGNEIGRKCGRFVAAADWIEEHLKEVAEAEAGDEAEGDEDEEESAGGPIQTPKVLVFSQSRRIVEQFTGYLHTRLGEGRQQMYHFGLPDSVLEDAVNAFQQEEDCQVLVCDELGGEGRRMTNATAVVHLDQPWSPERLERRVERLDRPGVEPGYEGDVTSVVLQGPNPWEEALEELYSDALPIYEDQPSRSAFALPRMERRVFEAWAKGGDALEQLVEELREELGQPPSHRESAFRAALEPHAAQLEEEAEFTELLDFVNGIDDALPVRHWARMIGIDDHRVRPGVYDFKWHWSSVRRDLEGFHIPEGDDPAEWEAHETVRYLSGTFHRKKALADETLEFFAPGHLLVDSLTEDALGPTDGRATVFARRLGGGNRGKTFAVIVARADLNEEVLEGIDVPEGLERRIHQLFWPETASAKVELDLQGNRKPSVVEDGDLIRRLEDSYEGPDADQKVEYEHFIRAIQDARRFREVLRDAVEVGLEDLREERQMLVDYSADQLEKAFASEIAYFESDAAEEEYGELAAEEAELRRKLVEAVRDYSLEIDAIAIVVGGTPEALMR